jgi:hypothetical protein
MEILLLQRELRIQEKYFFNIYFDQWKSYDRFFSFPQDTKWHFKGETTVLVPWSHLKIILE